MITIIIYLIMIPIMVFSHGNNPIQGSGFLEGFKHPIMGMDHLLAMLCVGIISSRLGGRAIWQVPLCFVIVMSMGCVIGLYGTSSQWVEPLIASSIVIFGVMLVVPKAMNLPRTLGTVALFALVHGFAHGKEMPIFVWPEIYIAGFMLSTTLIHVLGVGFGEAVNRLRLSTMIYRITGTVLVGSGLFFILNLN